MQNYRTGNTVFWLMAGGLALLTLLIHLFTCTNYELHRDEMLYMAMGNHLSFGYMSTPPMMGFLAFLITAFFGTSEMAVKFLPALASAASVIIIALMVRQLGGRAFAVFSACLAFILSPAFLHTGNLFMPVPFDQLFWLLVAYFSLKLVQTGNEKYWLALGAICGIAFLNKYSILFFAFSIFLALLLSEYRRVLLSKYFAGGLILALIIVSPNLVWQVQHHFPVITHMGELQRRQLANENPLTFLMGQLLLNLPVVLIWLTGLIACLFLKGERHIRFIGLSYVFVIIILMLGRGKAYYALGAYPMLFATGGYAMEKYFTGKLRFISYAFMGFATGLSGFLLPHALPVLPPEKMAAYCRFSSRYIGNWPNRWEDGTYHPLPQTYADMTGWKELAKLVAIAYSKLSDEDKKHCLIFAQNYGQAGAIAYYDKPIGLPEPVSLNDAFLFWAPDTTGKTILISIDYGLGDLEKQFNVYREFATVKNPYFREDGLQVYICRDPKPTWPSYYSQGVKQAKAAFNAGL